MTTKTKSMDALAGSVRRRRTASTTDEPVLAAVQSDTAVSPASESAATGIPPRVPLSEVTRHPLNPRGVVSPDEPEIAGLAETIREIGLLEPIVVAHRHVFGASYPDLVDQLPPDALYVLIAGERRLVAHHVVGLSEIRVISGDHLVTDGLDLEAMAVENIQRQALNPVQEARAFAELVVRRGLSQRTIAKRVGRTQAHVSRRLTLIKLPSDALDAITAGSLPVKDAELLAGGTDLYHDDEFARQAWSLYQQGRPPQFAVSLAAVARDAERIREAAIDEAAAAGVEVLDEADLPEPLDVMAIGPDEIEEARAAGTLAGVVTTTGLTLISTREHEADTPTSLGDTAVSPTDEHDPFAGEFAQAQQERKRLEQAQQAEDKARRQATTARRASAAIVVKNVPKTNVQLDALVDYIVQLAHHDERKMAMTLLGVDGTVASWSASLEDAADGVRRAAAWAIAVAHKELDASAQYRPWNARTAAYLGELTSAGYELSDYDRAKLAPLSDRTVKDARND